MCVCQPLLNTKNNLNELFWLIFKEQQKKGQKLKHTQKTSMMNRGH